MLPRPERITKTSEFAYVYHQKRSVANSLIVLYVGGKKRKESTPTRVGFIAGKKTHKHSVKRNRAKRLMREAYKEIRRLNEFPLNGFQNLIFLARSPIVDSSYKNVYDAIMDCVMRASRKFGAIAQSTKQ